MHAQCEYIVFLNEIKTNLFEGAGTEQSHHLVGRLELQTQRRSKFLKFTRCIHRRAVEVLKSHVPSFSCLYCKCAFVLSQVTLHM